MGFKSEERFCLGRLNHHKRRKGAAEVIIKSRLGNLQELVENYGLNIKVNFFLLFPVVLWLLLHLICWNTTATDKGPYERIDPRFKQLFYVTSTVLFSIENCSKFIFSFSRYQISLVSTPFEYFAEYIG